MYLPPGSTFLRLLQLPLSLWNSDSGQQALRAQAGAGLPDEVEQSHRLYLGNVSPYYDAPHVHGVAADLPDDCTVDQVILLHRHGSRGPLGEQAHILKLVRTLEEARDEIQGADLPPNLAFLKDGYAYGLVPKNLTAIGRMELFEHGVEFALRYPTFSTDEVVSTTVTRVIDSSHFFAQGFFGRDAEHVRYLTTDDVGEPVSWLAPWRSCPKLTEDAAREVGKQWTERYVPPIVKRFNTFIPGVEFSFEDVLGALYACPFDLAARGASPWCGVFERHELQALEYEFDLIMDYYTGHASKGDIGPFAGAMYVKKLVERLTEGTEPLYLDFGHETSILFAMSAMELNKDAVPLTPDLHHPPKHRTFRTSLQVPFAANMVWEKFSCKSSFHGPQLRLLLNRATYPLSACARSKKDRVYGTCAVDAFVKANERSLGVEFGCDVWNATCGAVSASV